MLLCIIIFYILSYLRLMACMCVENEYEDMQCTFKSKIITNEYIVKFHKYYNSITREKYIKAAATRYLNATEYTIIKRHNLASQYPSDFDVVRLGSGCIDYQNLEKHVAIKSVSPHASVTRHLQYVVPHNNSATMRKPLRSVPHDQITQTLNAHALWSHGITGKGVRVAVFDTGLAKDHPHFRNVKERTNWTNEKSLNDGVSHGTFVAGIIASAKECLGFAPDAELHIYRVFTNTQVSYTSWFLDAFNYAIFKKINVINLSIGGPDFMDKPFVEKVLELSANKVILVSAIGNDGPYYGTLNNPGDQSDVIGVGGLDSNEKVAKFSSRGMTTWELPYGYGRIKPDIVTFGTQIKGSDVNKGCRALSGTSVASPVVAGALTLIISGALNKLPLINPASMKQILIAGAVRLPDANIFEQGSGKLDLVKSLSSLLSYKAKVTLYPSSLDMTKSYMWPYSSQPLFYGSQPLIVNVTILNGITVSSRVAQAPSWQPYEDKNGDLLNVAVTYTDIIWPWTGWLAVHIAVNAENIEAEKESCGHISIIIQNLSQNINSLAYNETVYFPLCVKIIPKPPRHKRILWDQYHSLKYPSGYIPRDNLKAHSDPLDWRADHIHTNFRDMYIHLRNAGYYIDVLRTNYNCFSALEYGTLLLVDPEEEYFDEEITKLQEDVYKHGLSIIVFADWYNTTVMKQIKFFDENSRQWWIPDTGGSNIPALNELLKPYGLAFTDTVGEGYFRFGDHSMYYASGTTLAAFPTDADNIIIGAALHNQGVEFIENNKQDAKKEKEKYFLPILGLFQINQKNQAIYAGDSQQQKAQHEEFYYNMTYMPSDISPDRNPLLNKRVLLGLVFKSPLRKTVKENARKTKKAQALLLGKAETLVSDGDNKHRQIQRPEGRIAIYGDSNCLDSTNVEKKCFWLLNAMLEYTMNSHITSLLSNLNRAFEFKSNDIMEKVSPLRLASSNLHHYSKVLDPTNKFKKLTAARCTIPVWNAAMPINSTDFVTLAKQALAEPDSDNVELANHLKLSEMSGENGVSPVVDSMFEFIFIYCLTTFGILFMLYHFVRKRRILKKLLRI